MACWSPVGSDGVGRKICQVPLTFSPARVPRWSLPRTASGLIPNTAAASLTVTVGRLLLACRRPVGVLSFMAAMIAYPRLERHIAEGDGRGRGDGLCRVSRNDLRGICCDDPPSSSKVMTAPCSVAGAAPCIWNKGSDTTFIQLLNRHAVSISIPPPTDVTREGDQAADSSLIGR